MQQSPGETPTNKEIERKFMIKSIPDFMKVLPSKDVLQGYLPSFRIRHIGKEYKITIKRGKGIERDEFETDITKEEFDHNWILAKDKSLAKTRYYLEVGGHTFEADEYHWDLEGLFTIEVEFKTKEEALGFVPPDWFGEEVTECDELSNKSLAEDGLTQLVRDKIKRVNEIIDAPAMKLDLQDGVKWLVDGAINLAEKEKSGKGVFIGIAGGSNSGKTSRVTDEVIKRLEAEGLTVTKISMDDFYYGPSYMKRMAEMGIEINFDEPKAYDLELFLQKLHDIQDGKDVKINAYDFKNDPMIDAQDVKKSQVYIIEGLFALDDKATGGICDLKAMVNVSSHGRVIRRLVRDGGGVSGGVGRTGQKHVDILEQVLATVEPMDKRYVQPQTDNAHIIIDNDHDPAIESVNIKNSDSQMKFKITDTDIDNISTGLESIGFIFGGSFNQTDFYYSHAQKDIIANGEILRLRFNDVGPENAKTSVQYPILSYKYPYITDPHRTEAILDFEVNQKVVRLIDEEYSEVGFITKNRCVFQKGGISIALDSNLAGHLHSEEDTRELGDFIEIRGFKDEKEKEYLLDMIASLMNPENLSATPESYLNMMMLR